MLNRFSILFLLFLLFSGLLFLVLLLKHIKNENIKKIYMLLEISDEISNISKRKIELLLNSIDVEKTKYSKELRDNEHFRNLKKIYTDMFSSYNYIMKNPACLHPVFYDMQKLISGEILLYGDKAEEIMNTYFSEKISYTEACNNLVEYSKNIINFTNNLLDTKEIILKSQNREFN